MMGPITRQLEDVVNEVDRIERLLQERTDEVDSLDNDVADLRSIVQELTRVIEDAELQSKVSRNTTEVMEDHGFFFISKQDPKVPNVEEVKMDEEVWTHDPEATFDPMESDSNKRKGAQCIIFA